MNDNEKVKKLYEVVAKQQKIITALVKRAQAAAPAHRDEVTHGLDGTQVDPTRGHSAPITKMTPDKAAPNTGALTRDLEGEAILKVLPPVVKAALKTVQVGPSRDPSFDKVVKVFFHPGKDSDAAFNAVQKVVSALQQQNVLKGKNYQIVQA